MSPVRSNTIRRTRPDVSATEQASVKGARPRIRAFPGGAKRLKGYVRRELPERFGVAGDTAGRTLSNKVRPGAWY
ncbi:hypothetical protein GCM10010497_33530 [Streptomyces cinereoruber]|uniref:Uncharacterized protein n=1 Tax=Streptomyces cinereoruber TaxID=67260 RepID=A0AAV4KID3_9ACTN|nr:hypothetical protein GCM10010497_33530 [Streptomyces cinereoruber]